jgi:hypothetical protein
VVAAAAAAAAAVVSHHGSGSSAAHSDTRTAELVSAAVQTSSSPSKPFAVAAGATAPCHRSNMH